MKKNVLFLMLSSLLLLSVSCTTDSTEFDEGKWGGGSDEEGGSQPNPTVPEESDDLLNFTIAFDESDRTTYGSMSETVVTDENDANYDDFIENSSFTSVVTVSYDGATATVSNEVDGVSVSQNGAHIVVNSTVKGIEYVLKGATTDGSFKVYSEKKFKLSLSGTSIHNPVGAAINIQSSKRVFVVCAEGTTNTLTDGTSYTLTDGEDMKSCFFSEGQLIFSGSGSLSVTGNYKHAIVSDEYIRLRSGCNISVPSAVKDGIHTNDAVIIGGGVLNISSTEDAIQCEDGGITMTGGFVKVATTADKAHGFKSELDVIISGGALQAEVTGAGSKGISCNGNLTVSGGKITAFTSQKPLYEDDDLSSCAGIKCDGDIVIEGGEIALQSTGAAGKGMNCDGSITIHDGTVKVIQKYKRKKRFGRSINRRAPARFLLELKRKAEAVGGVYAEVDTKEFKASQYNHVTDTYEKIPLSQREKEIGNRKVQRDLYSAFLIRNADLDFKHPDREKCEYEFEYFADMQDQLILKMKESGLSMRQCFGF